jgi:hypothetical protein
MLVDEPKSPGRLGVSSLTIKAAMVPPTYHPHIKSAFAIPRCVGYAISLMSKGTVLAKVAEAHPTKNLDMMKPTSLSIPHSPTPRARRPYPK